MGEKETNKANEVEDLTLSEARQDEVKGGGGVTVAGGYDLKIAKK